MVKKVKLERGNLVNVSKWDDGRLIIVCFINGWGLEEQDDGVKEDLVIPVETLGALQQRNDTVDKKGQEQDDKSLLIMDSHFPVQLPLR